MIALTALHVDGEGPAREALDALLRTSPLVERVAVAGSAEAALRLLQRDRFDAVFTEIALPGLDGLELASLLQRFAEPPAVVFATSDGGHALEAFAVGAAGYLLKPPDPQQLHDLLRRILRTRLAEGADDLATVAVESPGRIRMIRRSEVEWVEACGDYVRLHTTGGEWPLVRLPISLLEQRWARHGFARIHRGYLVRVASVREVRHDGGNTVASVGSADLPVSRRHAHELRDRLLHHAGGHPDF